MRTIQISTDVFAALWAARRGNEQSEDEILRSLLKLKAEERPEIPRATGTTGFNDGRNGLRFPEGFEIFRKYHGQEYRARATGGEWVRLDTAKRYSSLNELNQSVGAKFQNAWRSWYCNDGGKRRLLHELRDPANIKSRAVA
jgi:hypothetical protein